MEPDKTVAQIMLVPTIEPQCAPLGLGDFFRNHYRPLLQLVMYAGATWQEAEDAVESVMYDLLRRWGEVREPYPYARKAVLNNFIKTKTRDKDRQHLRKERDETPDSDADSGALDPGLSVWEDSQWVQQLLESLPPTQGAVMALIVDGFTAAEIAELLGKTADTVRQNLRLARQRLKKHKDIRGLHVSHMTNPPEEDAR